MTSESELYQLDHKLYSVRKKIIRRKICANVNNIHQEIVKVTDFEPISKGFFNDRI